MDQDFIKTAAAHELPRLQAEAEGLAALRATGAIRVPEVRDCGVVDGQARLVLERFALVPLDRESGIALGRALAALHRHTAELYGWPSDNFIGLNPQHNTPNHNWAKFFSECRLRPQLIWARERGMDRETLKAGESLAERLAAFFVDYRPAVSLLHGDLWCGNAGALADGTPVVFDPAVHHGDRESDLAMAELFGGFPDSFYAAYQEAWPLDVGYTVRRTLYGLYHVLNHYNLFGTSYLGQAQRMIKRLLSELR